MATEQFGSLAPGRGEDVRVLETKILLALQASGGSPGTGGVTSGNGSPVGVVDPAAYVLYVQKDSDPPFQQWNSNGTSWT